MKYLDLKDHLQDLVNELPAPDQTLYRQMRHHRIEACFDNRIFIAYRIEGRTPKILNTLKVVDLAGNSVEGLTMAIEDRQGKEQMIGFQPTRPFNLDVFIHLPLQLQITWSKHKEMKVRSMLYGVKICQANGGGAPGTTYLDTLNGFRSKFPDVHVAIPA